MVAGHQPLTSDALAKLSSVHAVDTSKSVQRFVCSQMQHALFYAAEGIKTFDTVREFLMMILISTLVEIRTS